MDNGSEITGRALGEWALENGVNLAFIRSGKPIEAGRWFKSRYVPNVNKNNKPRFCNRIQD